MGKYEFYINGHYIETFTSFEKAKRALERHLVKCQDKI